MDSITILCHLYQNNNIHCYASFYNNIILLYKDA